MKYHFFKLLLLLLLFQACQRDHSIKQYYFPIDDLQDGKIYEYQSIGSEHDPPFYWFYRSIKTDEASYLTGIYYDYNFTPFQYIKEEVVSNGMLLSDFFWYQPDSLTGKHEKVYVEIESGNVFPFEVKNPPSVLISSIKWQAPTDSMTLMNFIRNRQYEKDTMILYKKKEINAIQLNVRELVDSERKGDGYLEQEYAAKEVYASGIGLVYFEKNIAPEWQMRYALKNIYDVKSFEEKFNQKLGE